MSRRKIDRSKQYPSFASFTGPEEAPDNSWRNPESPLFERYVRSMNTFTLVTAENEEDVRLYMAAHHCLPYDYFFTGSADQAAAVASAAAMISCTHLPEDEILAAIVLLGHSPCPQSLNALGKLAGGDPDHPLAGIADVALEECLHLGGPEALFIA